MNVGPDPHVPPLVGSARLAAVYPPTLSQVQRDSVRLLLIRTYEQGVAVLPRQRRHYKRPVKPTVLIIIAETYCRAVHFDQSLPHTTLKVFFLQNYNQNNMF